jgi:hypothetical protein
METQTYGVEVWLVGVPGEEVLEAELEVLVQCSLSIQDIKINTTEIYVEIFIEAIVPLKFSTMLVMAFVFSLLRVTLHFPYTTIPKLYFDVYHQLFAMKIWKILPHFHSHMWL